MESRKTVRKWFWVWDFDKEEDWLNEMAMSGWVLESVGFASYHFVRCEPGECFHSGDLPDRCPAADAVIAVPVIRILKGVPGRLISHGGIGANLRIAHGQVIDIRLDYQGHQRVSRIVAVSFFLQVLHHAVGRTQAVSASPGKHHRMDGLRRHQGIQELAFPGCRAAAPHVQAGRHSVFTNQHRASGARFGILRLPDPDRLNISDRYLHLRFSFGNIRAARQEQHRQQSSQKPAG